MDETQEHLWKAGVMNLDNTVDGAPRSRSGLDRYVLLKRFGLLSVPLSFVAVLIFALLNPPVNFHAPTWLFILNTVFISCTSLLFAFVAARSFVRVGRASLLLVGCGALVFAVGGFGSALVGGWSDDAADGEGVFGSAAFLASLFYFTGVCLLASQARLKRPRTARVFQTVIPYLGVLVLALVHIAAIRGDLLPVFFAQGPSATPLRHVMLGIAVLFLGGSAFLSYEFYLHSRSELAYWYALALTLSAIGLLVLMGGSSVWSAVHWLGLASQYLGGIYLVIAVLSAKSLQDGENPWQEALTAFVVHGSEEYEALVETAMDAIVVMDGRGRVLSWNPSAERIFGYARVEAVGMSLIDLVVEEGFRASLWQELYTFLETGHSTLLGRTTETRGRRKNGQVFDAEFTVSARETVTGWVGTLIIRDISERKKAEQEREDLLAKLEQERDRLRQSNFKTQSILSTITDSYLRLDRDWRIVEVNSSAERGIGKSRGELIGQPVTVVFEEPEYSETFRQFQNAVTEQKPIHLEAYSKSKNVWYEVHAYPFPEGVEVYYRDITQRKQIQEQVNKLNRALERRAAELESVNRELESFSYSVSHDLRAPLASIHSFSQLLLQDYAAQLPEEARRFLEQVQANAIAMSDLIEALLALSRSTRVPLTREEIVTAELVRQVLEMLEKERASRQIEIVVGELPNCQADPTLLKQVWINLLSNAVKFTRPRAVARIEIDAIQTSASSPLATLQPPGAQDPPTGRPCTYFVRDNGVGFDMANAQRLFGVFQRLHGEDEFEGYGVGLATVERIVRRHGGRVWAEAEVDKGATFYFTLTEL